MKIHFGGLLEGLVGITTGSVLRTMPRTCCCCCCSVTSVVSESVRPHRRQPTRLLCPWDTPGKNTGVGCHFLLQCMKMKSESKVAQSCPTLGDPMTAAYQTPPSMGFSRQEYWSGVPLYSPRRYIKQVKKKSLLLSENTFQNQ